MLERAFTHPLHLLDNDLVELLGCADRAVVAQSRDEALSGGAGRHLLAGVSIEDFEGDQDAGLNDHVFAGNIV